MTTISWREVNVWQYDGSVEPYKLDRESEEHAAAMREYRATGGIVGHYLADPNDYDEDDDDICVAGPDRDDIDWTGLSAQ